MDYNLPFPDVYGREKFGKAHTFKRGDVSAFRYYGYARPRTGIIVFEDTNFMHVAVNLYDEEGSFYVCDDLPDDEDLELFVANDAETCWGLSFFFEHFFGHVGDVQNFIRFIDEECPKEREDYHAAAFCRQMLSMVPPQLPASRQAELKKMVRERIKATRGVQFNKYRMEYYCFLLAVLMICERDNHNQNIQLLQKEWFQFSWMYGMSLGQVVGCDFPNITSMVNQCRNHTSRRPYLHLYLPLVKGNEQNICRFGVDKKDKLEQAIDKAEQQEVLEKQKPDLDMLYGILFPKHFLKAIKEERPAATIAELKQAVAAKESRIKELEGAVDDLTSRYNEVLSQLTNAVSDVESEIITPDDLFAAFLRLPTDLAFGVYEKMSTLLGLNRTWQKYAPLINEQILKNANELQKRQDDLGETMLKAVNQPAVTINGDLVVNKETNIDKNYGPNIEHNGGTLSLPDKGQ